jgi:hypothetical protein
MSVESLTYADLAGRLGTSREAARSLVRRLKLPRQTGNDGTARVNVDLAGLEATMMQTSAAARTLRAGVAIFVKAQIQCWKRGAPKQSLGRYARCRPVPTERLRRLRPDSAGLSTNTF